MRGLVIFPSKVPICCALRVAVFCSSQPKNFSEKFAHFWDYFKFLCAEKTRKENLIFNFYYPYVSVSVSAIAITKIVSVSDH